MEFGPVIAVLAIFIGLPWIIFHYITKWKTQGSITTEDENLLDELHDLARRLDDRMVTIERIMGAENPNWRQLAADPTGLEPGRLEHGPGQTPYVTEQRGYAPARRHGQ